MGSRTRTNLLQNPSFGTNTTGYSQQGTGASIARQTDGWKYGTTYVRVSGMTEPLTCGVQMVNATYRPAVAEGEVVTVSAWVRGISVAANLRIQLVFYDVSPAVVIAESSAIIEIPVGEWTRISLTKTVPATAVTVGTRIQQVGGAGYTATSFDAGSLMIEKEVQPFPFFDGSVADAALSGAVTAWTGTAHASTSTVTYAEADRKMYAKSGGLWLQVFPDVSSEVPQGFNAASGGTESTVTNYNGTGETWKVHRFTSSQTLTVTQSVVPFRVLVAGGPGAGGAVSSGRGGGGGGGGDVKDTTIALAEAAHAVTVGGTGVASSLGAITANPGSAGGPGNTASGTARNGGTSGNGNLGGFNSPDSWSGGGGAGAGGAGGNAVASGSPGTAGPGVSSNIRGSANTYGAGAAGSSQNNAGPGQAAEVIVAYRIA